MKIQKIQWMRWAMLMGCFLPILLRADVFLKQKHHTDGFTVMGKAQPPKEYIGGMWITENKARSDMEEGHSVIVRLDKKCLYLLDHQEKTAIEIPLDGSEKKEQSSEIEESELPTEMQGMMKSMMKPKVQVKETGETRVIHGWSCKKYVQTLELGMGAPTVSEIWASTEVKIDPQVLEKFNSAMMAMNPMMREMASEIQKETQKIKGISVLTETITTMMNQKVKSSVELLEVKTGTAPPEIFEIPAGYQLKKGMQ